MAMFQRVNRTDAEKIFMIFQNVSGSTITAGYSAAFDTGASVNGVRVSMVTSANLQAFAGIADEDVADSAYGRFQVYGYRSSIYITSSAGSSVAGDNLITVASNWGLRPTTGLATQKAFGFLCEAITASGSSSTYYLTAKAFIRAL